MSLTNPKIAIQINHWQLHVHFFGLYFWINLGFILFMILLVGGILYGLLQSTPEVKVLWTSGDNFYRLTEGANARNVDKGTIPARAIIQSGTQASPTAGNDFIALDYGQGLYALLQPNSRINLLTKEGDPPKLKLHGQSQLAFAGANTKRIVINKVLLESEAAEVQVNTGTGYIQLQVISGIIHLPAKGDRAKTSLSAGKTLVLSAHAKALESNTEIDYRNIIVGFHQLSALEPVGVIVNASPQVKVLRNNQFQEISSTSFLLAIGDKVQNKSDKAITLAMNTGDMIRVYPEGELQIDSKNAMEMKHGAYSFLGRIRATLSKYAPSRRVTFRSSNAIVTARGTDVEITSTTNATKVLCAFGKIDLTDKQGNQVTIPAGMMSQIIEGNPPQQPTLLPPAKAEQLLSSSFQLKPGPKLRATSKKIILGLVPGITLNWDKPLVEAHLNILNQWVSLPLGPESEKLALNAELLKTTQAGRYPIMLRVAEKWGGTTVVKGSITLCGPSKIDLNETDREKIRQFQLKNGLLSDGIVGEMTSKAFGKVYQCLKLQDYTVQTLQ